MLENSCRKTCGPFRLTVMLKIHTLVSGNILPYVHQRQKFQFLREKGICRGPLAEWVLPSLAGEVNREKSCHSFLPIRPSPLDGRQLSGLQQPSVWQVMDAVKGTSLQKWSCSGPTADRLSCGRVCCLRRPPRRRGATGRDTLCQGSLLHWR